LLRYRYAKELKQAVQFLALVLPKIVCEICNARHLLDKDAYYPILNQNDNSILKAISALSGKK
jgi:hypothetical protein